MIPPENPLRSLREHKQECDTQTKDLLYNPTQDYQETMTI